MVAAPRELLAGERGPTASVLCSAAAQGAKPTPGVASEVFKAGSHPQTGDGTCSGM